ncbi:hypothetical protein HHL24_27140 [Paraburkholderia sp. RP-4-7]|jgi:hypothetical protein|uniref:Uncharacterized protein n=1 Tax=Paraburkholderia polaris TaxID=2728848 RepID=A0A848IIS0_9BURK|nr:hypothetical protein [Paraburkholderia polaris]NMM01601.1 hypothetical protein [Paraburkholderia polaris]
MNKTETFAPVDAANVDRAEYDALRLTGDEYLKLLSSGHPGCKVSLAQGNAEAFRVAAESGHLIATSLPPNVSRK